MSTLSSFAFLVGAVIVVGSGYLVNLLFFRLIRGDLDPDDLAAEAPWAWIAGPILKIVPYSFIIALAGIAALAVVCLILSSLCLGVHLISFCLTSVTPKSTSCSIII